MGFFVPIALAGATFVVPRVYSHFCPPGVDSREKNIHAFFAYNPSPPHDNREERIQRHVRVNIEKIEAIVQKISAFAFLLRVQIDRFGFYHPKTHHFFTTVLRDNLWVTAFVVSLLWKQGLFSAINPYLTLGVIGLGSSVSCYCLHDLRSLAHHYLPEPYRSFFSPSQTLLDQNFQQIKLLLSRVLPWLKGPNLSINQIWNILYTHLFDDKDHFDTYFETFEKNIEKILPFLIKSFPQLSEDLLCQLFLSKNELPEFVHDDEVFRENICPITRVPIRNPMKDLSSDIPHHIYEKNWIVLWVQQHFCSPLTRRAMTLHDLQEDLALKQQIEKRLSFFKEQMLLEKLQFPRRNDLAVLSIQSWRQFKETRQQQEIHERAQQRQEAELALASEAVSRAIDNLQEFFRFGRDYRRNHQPPPEDNIPEDLYADPILQEHICPITLCPIRHPLQDPTTGCIYEAHAIRLWVQQHQLSPISRQPLRLEELQSLQDLENTIQQRIRFYDVV